MPHADATPRTPGEVIAGLREAKQLTRAALSRLIEGVRPNPETKYTVIAGRKYFLDTEGRAALRAKAVAMLRRLAGPASPLAGVGDDDLMAECRRRGLIA